MRLQFVPMRHVVQQGRLQLDQDLEEGEGELGGDPLRSYSSKYIFIRSDYMNLFLDLHESLKSEETRTYYLICLS